MSNTLLRFKIMKFITRSFLKSKSLYFLPKYYYISKNYNSTSTETANNNIDGINNWKNELYATMKIFSDFITVEEEKSLIAELDPYLRRLRYEFSHWDNAIHGYRETERLHWTEDNKKVINKIREKAFPPNEAQLGPIHVLDLSAEGWIKPHVDSVKFCGDIIAGLSLLSDSVMRLRLVNHEETCKADFFLPRRSLYIMSGAARYKFKHEILESKESVFDGSKIHRERRVSIICRSEPKYENENSDITGTVKVK